MSVLLDALKKAALEKQKKEHTPLKSVETYSTTTTPPDSDSETESNEVNLEKESNELTKNNHTSNAKDPDEPDSDEFSLLSNYQNTIDSITSENDSDLEQLSELIAEPNENFSIPGELDPELLESHKQSQESYVSNSDKPEIELDLEIDPDYLEKLNDDKASIDLLAEPEQKLHHEDEEDSRLDTTKNNTDDHNENSSNDETTIDLLEENEKNGNPGPNNEITKNPNDDSVDTKETKKQSIIYEEKSTKIHFDELRKSRIREERNGKKKLIAIYSLVLLISISTIFIYYYYGIMNSSDNFISTPNQITSTQIPPENSELENADEIGKINLDSSINTDTNLGLGSDQPITQQTKTEAVKQSNVDLADKPVDVADTNQILEKTPTANRASKPNTKNRPPISKLKNKTIKPGTETKTTLISKGKDKTNPLSDAILRGYTAFNSGDLKLAKESYQKAINLDQNNRDAILGMAAVAMMERNYQTALNFYQKRLTIAPKDSYALSGILSIASLDNPSPELFSRVNEIVEENPGAAHLFFLKGSLLASDARWNAAQSEFFKAWSLEPNRAEYVFNLAVSLDQLDQKSEALRFYKDAYSLAKNSPTNLDIHALLQRIAILEKSL